MFIVKRGIKQKLCFMPLLKFVIDVIIISAGMRKICLVNCIKPLDRMYMWIKQ